PPDRQAAPATTGAALTFAAGAATSVAPKFAAIKAEETQQRTAAKSAMLDSMATRRRTVKKLRNRTGPSTGAVCTRALQITVRPCLSIGHRQQATGRPTPSPSSQRCIIIYPRCLITYPRCLIIYPRCLITYHRCLIIYPRCLITYPRCLIIYPRCLIIYPRCLTIYHRCLITYPRCLIIYPRCLIIHPRCLTIYHRCLITYPRCLITSPRCLITYPRCLITHPRCLITYPRCLITYPRCLIPYPRCLIPYPRCLIPYPRCLITYPRRLIIYPRCLITYPRCLITYPRCLIPYPRCLIPYPRCLIPYPRCLITYPRCLIIYPRCLIPYPRCLITHSSNNLRPAGLGGAGHSLHELFNTTPMQTFGSFEHVGQQAVHRPTGLNSVGEQATSAQQLLSDLLNKLPLQLQLLRIIWRSSRRLSMVLAWSSRSQAASNTTNLALSSNSLKSNCFNKLYFGFFSISWLRTSCTSADIVELPTVAVAIECRTPAAPALLFKSSSPLSPKTWTTLLSISLSTGRTDDEATASAAASAVAESSSPSSSSSSSPKSSDMAAGQRRCRRPPGLREAVSRCSEDRRRVCGGGEAANIDLDIIRQTESKGKDIQFNSYLDAAAHSSSRCTFGRPWRPRRARPAHSSSASSELDESLINRRRRRRRLNSAGRWPAAAAPAEEGLAGVGSSRWQ
uniref:Mucin-19-like n=1 Tax=Macrostomum lignano TaxID=282301 RepID=A0A1I8IHB3_9PLAT